MNGMKTKQLVSIMIGCLTALCVTSCLGDDTSESDSQTLTKAQIAQCFMTVAGNYTGKLYYEAKSSDGYATIVDSLDTSWYIPTDSTLIITDFPAKVVAELVSYQPLKAALAEAPNKMVNCKTWYLKTSPIELLVNPYTIEYDLEFDGKQHKVHVVFYANNTYSFGVYDSGSNSMVVKIIPAVIYVDEKQTSYLTSSQLIFFSNSHAAI